MVDRVVVTEGSTFGVCSQAPWRYSITVPRQLTKDEQVILATFAECIVRCEPIETQSGTNGVQKDIDLIERLLAIEMHFRREEQKTPNKTEKKTYIERACTIGDAVYALTVPNWISVENRLPEPICRCLAYTPYNMYGNGMITATFTEHGWMTPGYIGQITHWMPLPEPPDDVPNGFRIGGVTEVTTDMLEEGGDGDAAD